MQISYTIVEKIYVLNQMECLVESYAFVALSNQLAHDHDDHDTVEAVRPSKGQRSRLGVSRRVIHFCWYD